MLRKAAVGGFVELSRTLEGLGPRFGSSGRSRSSTRTHAFQLDVRDGFAAPQTGPQTELLAKLERMGGQIDAGRTERLGFFGIADRTQLASIAVDRPLALSFQGASGIGA